MGASAAAAASGSSWASRSTAVALRISPLSRSSSPIAARACSARCVSPSRTSVCSVCDRSRLASACSVTSTRPAARPPGTALSAASGTAAQELQQAASVAEPHPGRRFDLGPEGPARPVPVTAPLPRAVPGRPSQSPAPDTRRRHRLLGPAMPPGQLDRLPGPLRPQRERPPARQLCPVRQGGDLQERPPDPAGQGEPLLQVPVRLVEASGPQFGDAEVDQRQRPQVLAQPETRRVVSPRGGQQRLRLLGHGREVPALAGQPHAYDSEDHLRALTPARRY